MPVLKTIRKINACKMEDVTFQGFWPQVHNICRAWFFRIATFGEHLLPTASEYPLFSPLTKSKVEILMLTVIKSVLNLKYKSKFVKL